MSIEQQPVRILLNKDGKGQSEHADVDFTGPVSAFWWSLYDEIEFFPYLHTVRLHTDSAAPKRVVVDFTTKVTGPIDLQIVVFADVK